MEAVNRTGTPTPAAGLNRPALDLLQDALRAVQAKDLPALDALVTDDAVFIDPHYPIRRMAGRGAVARGLGWSFGTIDSFRFRIVQGFQTADGEHAAVEVDCDHTLRGGRHLAFRQVFVADARAGRITRLEAYEPYGPGGLVGWVLRLTRFGWWVRRLVRR